MSFVSLTHEYISSSDRDIFTLEDDEFGEIEITEPNIGVGIVKEYIKRGYSVKQVGRNMALFTIRKYKHHGVRLEDSKLWQDRFCGEQIENWQEYAKERDAAIKILLVLQ